MEANKSLSEADRWKSEALDEVFRALASDPVIAQSLIYKGARVLRLRLQEKLRASFDIDASLATLAANVELRASDASRQKLRDIIHRAILSHLESQEVVKYALRQSELVLRRKSGPHPRGWDVYWLNLDIQDLRRGGNATIENLRIDIAALERMSDRSTSPLEIGGHLVTALTLERIAGEKLRAFLSHLPAYRRKIEETTRLNRRVKDLYDLAWIVRKRPVADLAFWSEAAVQFRMACESRYIDCQGILDFLDDWPSTVQQYETERTIPGDVTIDECRTALEGVVKIFENSGVLPIYFELPPILEDIR